LGESVGLALALVALEAVLGVELGEVWVVVWVEE